jgi:predicted nucleic acid-binding Zn ribbon protein
MHEIGHEQNRRYVSFPSYHFSKQLQSDEPLYKCQECNANFELKSRFTLHELSHEKQRARPCCSRNASLASASDLCTGVVRVCKLCGRRFFASFGLSQSGEHQFKCNQSNKVFGHAGHLAIHKIGHNQSESFSSSPKQEIVIVKEEVLSDDEGALNYASINDYDDTEHTSCPVDTKCLETEDNNSIAAENKTDHGSNVVRVLAGSALENFDTFSVLKSDLGVNSKSVKQHLGNNRDVARKLNSLKNCGTPVKVNVKKLKQRLQLETKSMTAPSYTAVPAEHRFKCQECSETFELNSHFVMHEIGHEQYRRYVSFPRYHFSKQLQSDKPIYKCQECNANFELKSRFTLHELSHEKQRSRPCRCRSASLASSSDLCTCVVRVCKSCGRRFFATFGLRNWTLCIKCFSPGDSKGNINSSTPVKSEEIQVQQVPSKRNRNKTSNRKMYPMLVDAKRLCCSCGKMSVNVIKFRASWMCYDCWKARLKYKNVSNFLGLSNRIVPQ